MRTLALWLLFVGVAGADVSTPPATAAPPERESPLELVVRYLDRLPGTATRRFLVTLTNRGRKPVKLLLASPEDPPFRFYFDEPVESLPFKSPHGPAVRTLAPRQHLSWVVRKDLETAYRLTAIYHPSDEALAACADCLRDSVQSPEVMEFLPEFRLPITN